VFGVSSASDVLLVSRIAAWNKLKAYDIGITPEVASARVRAASFSATAQTRLFETIIARDADLGNAIDQRCLALAGARWRFGPAEDVTDRQAKPVLDALPETLLSQEVLEHAALFRQFGYAVIEIEWARDWRVIALHDWPFAATEILNGEVRIYVDGMQVPVDDHRFADKFIILKASQHDPAGAAHLRRCVGPWLTKSYLARDWRAYLERFGDPLVIGHYDDATPASDAGVSPQQAVITALTQLKGSAIAAIPKSMEVTLLADARGDASNAFDKLWDRCNQSIYNSVLGQSSTVYQARSGSRSSDEVRERVLDSLIEADARIIAGTLRRDLLSKVEAHRANGKRLVDLEFSWERDDPQAVRAEVMLIATQAGIPFDKDAAREELGLTAPSEAQLAADAKNAADTHAQLAKALATPKAGGVPTVPPEEPGGVRPAPGKPAPPEKQTLAQRLLKAVKAVFSGEPDAEPFRSGAGEMHKALDAIAQASSKPLHAALDKGLIESIRAQLRDDMTQAEIDQVFQRALTAAHVKPVADVFQQAILAARLNGRLLAAAQLARLRRRKESGGGA